MKKKTFALIDSKVSRPRNRFTQNQVYGIWGERRAPRRRPVVA